MKKFEESLNKRKDQKSPPVIVPSPIGETRYKAPAQEEEAPQKGLECINPKQRNPAAERQYSKTRFNIASEDEDEKEDEKSKENEENEGEEQDEETVNRYCPLQPSVSEKRALTK